MQNISRRHFLEFLGIGTASLLTGPVITTGTPANGKPIRPLPPSEKDLVSLIDGLDYKVLIKWKDRISGTDSFGFNNDYIAFLPLEGNPDDGLLWVNHEYIHPMFVCETDAYGEYPKTKKQVEREMYNVGGSIIRIKKEKESWRVVKDDPLNRRITARTEIPFNWSEPIVGSRTAMGTLANCSGGITPWGTILTCEENYDLFYGERDYSTGNLDMRVEHLGWNKFYNNPPEHYGWVVEVDPMTGKCQKHIALGRCAHECATIAALPDGRLVVYSGDDAIDECLYKFVSSKPGSISEGTLYVANIGMGKWLPLDHQTHPVLNKLFRDQTEVLVRLRQAARYIGGSPLDRPEDIEINPANGDVLVALTNNARRKNWVGSIMKIVEKDGKHDALEFTSETFLSGGEETGFACPDNLAFDPKGNLWFTSDISGTAMNNPKYPAYTSFKNNSLFVVPCSGPQAGRALRVANAPVHAEFTGPFFSPDGKTLFLSVQHPGEYSPSLKALSSHWPEGGNAIPKPAVIAIYGVDEIV